MRAEDLNGWQRLWIVLCVAWLIFVTVETVAYWPTDATIPERDVYARMKSEDRLRLVNNFEVALGSVPPLVTKLREDKDFMAASTADEKAYVSHIEPDFSETSSDLQDTYVAWVTGRTHDVTIDGRILQFAPSILEAGVNNTVQAYRVALAATLKRQRTASVLLALASWMVPMLILFAVGWAVGWVQRGFKQ